MNAAIVVAALVGATVAVSVWRRRRARRLYPQDFAFAVCTAFGPELALPREVRIRRVFPSIEADVLSSWLRDFSRLDYEIGRLAQQGGTQRLGNEVVRDALKRSFPFLVGRGLNQAIFFVWYAAAHDGHDKSPDPT